ncbi:TPR-like protein [Gamsiella multidivaricata]|uniref:TPR-like protein n=1 Tax=Gamsiella multidivaricata TaxID=101098 RepID=UPI0022208AF3|nr:TPR-like protein [Gamsiella multidivaricata]KAG0369138.1 ER membrane complex subunit 2 [Gamsiella multidivaricata]KAI7823043.1 TPR-like protein [Gamsiella multidivaricata]
MVNAAKVLQDLRASAERRPDVVVRLGKPLVESGAVLKLDVDAWLVYEQVAIAALDLGDDVLALKCIQALEKKFPGSARVRRLHGMQLEAVGKLKEAGEIYKTILQEDETNVLAAKRQVMLLRAMGLPSEAIAALVKYLDVNYTDFEGWLQLADLYLEELMYSQAAFCMEEVIMLQPQNHIFHLKYAEILYAQENVPLALKQFCRVVELCKDHVRGLYGIKLCTSRLLKAAPSKDAAVTSPEDLKAIDLLATERLLTVYGSGNTAASVKAASAKWIESV